MIASILIDKSLVSKIPLHILRQNVALAQAALNVAEREYDATADADFTVQMVAFDRVAIARADLRNARSALEARCVSN